MVFLVLSPYQSVLGSRQSLPGCRVLFRSYYLGLALTEVLAFTEVLALTEVLPLVLEILFKFEILLKFC